MPLGGRDLASLHKLSEAAQIFVHLHELRLALLFGDLLVGYAERNFVQRSDTFSQGLGAQVGAGFDLRLCDRDAMCIIRAQVGYRRFQSSARDLAGWRASVGAGIDVASHPSSAATTTSSGRHHADIGVGFTMATPKDVNLSPLCESLGLPCGSPRTFPDFGLAISPSLRLNDVVSLTGEFNVWANNWVPASSLESDTNHVRAVLAGVRVQTHPLYVSSHDVESIRLFAQVLTGEQWSTILPRRRVVQPGFGVDFISPRQFIVRLQFDYSSVPGPVRDLSGGRFMFGLAFGR